MGLMKQIILLTQLINIFLIVIETWVVFKNMRKRMHYYLFLNCMAMLLCSVGSLLQLFVETEEAFFLTFMMSWTGKIGVLISVFFFCIKLCERKFPIIITTIISGFAVISYIVIATTRKTELFYKELQFIKEGGVTVLLYEQGPWQILWNITTVAIVLICLLMLLKAALRENSLQNRKKYIAIIVALLIEIIIGYLTVLPIGRYYDFYIPSCNTLIEVDGDHYHSYNILYENMSPMQKKNHRVDKIKNKWAREHNIPLIRIWEHDINKNGKKVMEMLKEELKKNTELYNLQLEKKNRPK